MEGGREDAGGRVGFGPWADVDIVPKAGTGFDGTPSAPSSHL